MAKQYKVTAPYITVLVTSGDGLPRMAGFYRDHVLPPEVPDAQIKAHLDSSLIEEMDVPAAEVAKVNEEGKAAAEAASDVLLRAQRERDEKLGTAKEGKPERSDPKSAWVAYAVAKTAGTPGALTETEANDLSKAELVERFK